MDSYHILIAAINTQQTEIEKHQLTVVAGIATRPGHDSPLMNILVGNSPKKLSQQLQTAAEANVNTLSEGVEPQPEGCAVGHVRGSSDVFVSVTGTLNKKKRREIAQCIAKHAADAFNNG
jgi:hypothetical protein